MSRGWHSTEGSDSQIRISGQSVAVDEADHNNDGAELTPESHQKVGTPLRYFSLLNPSNLEK